MYIILCVLTALTSVYISYGQSLIPNTYENDLRADDEKMIEIAEIRLNELREIYEDLLYKECLRDQKICSTDSPVSVAFHAQLTKRKEGPGKVVFDFVHTNVGCSYHRINGSLRIPGDAIYFFTWTIESMSTRTMSSLRINGNNVIGTLRTDPLFNNATDSSTNFVAVSLKKGDDIGVFLEEGNAQPICSTFSGWKIDSEKSLAVFHAKLTIPDRSKSIIKFNDVQLNTDGGYSNITGKFTATTPGVYLFCTSAEAYPRQRIVLKVVSRESYFLADAGGANVYDTASICVTDDVNPRSLFYSGDYGKYVSTNQTTITGISFPVNTDAFTVSLKKTYQQGPLFYDEVKNNLGYIFNHQRSDVMIKTSGIYMFSWNTKSTDSTEGVITEIIVNGMPKGQTYSEPEDGTIEVSTGVVVLQLYKGDKIWIYVRSGTPNSWATHFTGILLSNN